MRGLKDWFGKPETLRAVHGYAAVFWLAMAPVSMLTSLSASVRYLTGLSVYAIITGHWASWQASRVEVRQDNDGDGDGDLSPPDRTVTAIPHTGEGGAVLELSVAAESEQPFALPVAGAAVSDSPPEFALVQAGADAADSDFTGGTWAQDPDTLVVSAQVGLGTDVPLVQGIFLLWLRHASGGERPEQPIARVYVY